MKYGPELLVGCALLGTLGTGTVYGLTADPVPPSGGAADDLEVCRESELALSRFAAVAQAAGAGVADATEAAEATRTGERAVAALMAEADDDELHEQLTRAHATVQAFGAAVADGDSSRVVAESQAARAQTQVLAAVCREVEERQ